MWVLWELLRVPREVQWRRAARPAVCLVQTVGVIWVLVVPPEEETVRGCVTV